MKSLLLIASAIMAVASPFTTQVKAAADCCDCCSTGVCGCAQCTCCDCATCPSCQ